MWFSEHLFLERNWVKDENTLKVEVCSLDCIHIDDHKCCCVYLFLDHIVYFS